MIRKACMTLGAVALVGALAAAPAGATNGMDMIGYGARAIGMGGADVAVDGDAASAAGGNPAVVSKATPNSANIGATFLMPKMTYKDPSQEEDGEDQVFPMPSLGYVHTMANSPWSFGVGLYAQGGMGVDFENIDTPAGTEDEIYSKVAFMRANPLVAYKVNEDLSLGGTVMIGYAMAKFSLFPETPGMNSGLDVDDLSSWGFAGKVGFQYKVGPQWRIGATYTSESTIDLEDGDAEVNYGPAGKVTYDASMEDFTWPQEVEFGVAYLPMKGLTLAADVKWINWSATIDKPKLKLSNPNAPVPPGYESISQTFDMNWDDQWVWAIGAEYAINDAHTVRCGFNYGNNPVPDEQLNPLFPAIVTTHLTLGYGYTHGKWSFDAAYEHAFEESQENPNGIEIDHSQNTVSFAATYRY